jgi:hypothetical protein
MAARPLVNDTRPKSHGYDVAFDHLSKEKRLHLEFDDSKHVVQKLTQLVQVTVV